MKNELFGLILSNNPGAYFKFLNSFYKTTKIHIQDILFVQIWVYLQQNMEDGKIIKVLSNVLSKSTSTIALQRHELFKLVITKLK